jgi:NAD(P)-dependent dehydrogenase (short-subunit alcohol dehydrogenase family)
LAFDSRKYYYPIEAYCNSKLAQVLFAKHLNGLLKEKELKIQVHAVHPGIVNTELFEYSTTTAIPWFKNLFYKVSFISS